jgi:hypothetical protein
LLLKKSSAPSDEFWKAVMMHIYSQLHDSAVNDLHFFCNCVEEALFMLVSPVFKVIMFGLVTIRK